MESKHKNAIKLSMIWVLTDEKYGALQYADNKKVIQDIADAISKDMVTPVSAKKWKALRDSATAAIYLAYLDNALPKTMAAYETARYATTFTNYAVTIACACKAYSFENSEADWHIATTNKINELVKNSN